VRHGTGFAAFILSTGRCGTQWIAHSVEDAYPDLVRVTHEPLHDRYDPRSALGQGACGQAVPGLVREHADAIERGLAERAYLECGHPCWSTLPWLAKRLQGCMRVIHLTRHPVPTACSWLTHGAFQPPLLPHMSEKVLLSPNDQGIRFQEYRPLWPDLSSYEKCLFYWAEVNALGLALESRCAVPWLHLRYEDLHRGDGMQRLANFLGLPPRSPECGAGDVHVDGYRHVIAQWPDWRMVSRHPRVLEIASRLGYRWDDVDEDALRRRYLGIP
jgi:hypothetical protein